MANEMKSTKILLLSVVVLILVCVNPSTAAVPVANFSGAPTTGVVPLTVQFFDNSTGFPTGWAWYFGDENYTAPWTQVTVGDGMVGKIQSQLCSDAGRQHRADGWLCWFSPRATLRTTYGGQRIMVLHGRR